MIAGIKVNLGGTDYVVPPLNLGALIEMEDQLKDLRLGAVDAKSVGVVIECAHRALRRNYPDVKKEWIGEVIDVGNMVDVMQAILDVSGLRRKKQEETSGEMRGE